ncbi:hypothetical protein JPSP27_02040 [Staphylococcus pseudintermedius]
MGTQSKGLDSVDPLQRTTRFLMIQYQRKRVDVHFIHISLSTQFERTAIHPSQCCLSCLI